GGGPDFGQHVEARPLGHVHVQEDQLGIVGDELGDGLGAVAGRDHLVAPAPQELLQQSKGAGVIVHDQNPHQGPPPPLKRPRPAVPRWGAGPRRWFLLGGPPPPPGGPPRPRSGHRGGGRTGGPQPTPSPAPGNWLPVYRSPGRRVGRSATGGLAPPPGPSRSPR